MTHIRDRLDSYLVRAECPLCGHDREGIFVRGAMGELVCRGHEGHPLHPEHGLTLLKKLRAAAKEDSETTATQPRAAW